MDSLVTEKALLIEVRTAHLLAQALDRVHWRELVKVARNQSEEELSNLTLRGDDGPTVERG